MALLQTLQTHFNSSLSLSLSLSLCLSLSHPWLCFKHTKLISNSTLSRPNSSTIPRNEKIKKMESMAAFKHGYVQMCTHWSVLITESLGHPKGISDLQFNYYAQSCPEAEEIIKQQVTTLYYKHGNTAISWIRNLFHDCFVKSCDASLLLETANGIQSEKESVRSLGMRNFKYVNTIKEALENKCPLTVSCADIVALSARDGIVMLGGPRIEMKTGRMDSKESYPTMVDNLIPNHNDTSSFVLSSFESIGIDVEGVVALLGAHSVGRVHCVNLVHRLYPTVDPTLDPDYAEYLKGRCPSPTPDPKAVLYARNDRETPMVLDNFYYKNLLSHKGLLQVDQQLASDPITSPYVQQMAADNGYFHDQFSRAVILLSERNPLTVDQGEIRKDCRYVNTK